MKKHLLILSLFASIFSMIFILGCVVRSETLAAMLNAADAIKNKDWDKFEVYVDVDSLLEQAVDLTIDEVKKQAGGLGSLVDSVGGFGKPYVISATKKEFKKLFKQGKLTEQASGLSMLPSSELLANMVRLMGVPQENDYYQVKKVEKLEAGEVLNMDVKMKKNDPWLNLVIESKQTGDHYRITKIRNLKQIYKKLLR